MIRSTDHAHSLDEARRVYDLSLEIIAHDLLATLVEDVDLPVIEVAAEARPDVADLWRIQKQEAHLDGGGVQDWIGVVTDDERALALMYLEVRRPVTCEFGIRFDLSKHLGLLGNIILTGALCFTTESLVALRADGMTPRGLAVQVKTDALVQVIKTSGLFPR